MVTEQAEFWVTSEGPIFGGKHGEISGSSKEVAKESFYYTYIS